VFLSLVPHGKLIFQTPNVIEMNTQETENLTLDEYRSKISIIPVGKLNQKIRQVSDDVG
jgi:hypothetical protein